MPKSEHTTRTRFMTQVTGKDVALLNELRDLTGVVGGAEIVRLALRALYKQQTGRDWRPAAAVEVNGQASR